MPEVRAFLLFLCFAAPAHADLYRWIDPQTGSVKLSSMPPSDPTIGAEIVPYRAPVAPKPSPTAAAKPKPAANTVEALEARWSELLAQLSGVTPQDFNKGGEGIKQQVEAYEAVRAQLDRLDPAGAPRRQAESAALVEKLRQGFPPQFNTLPPGQQK